MEPHVRDDAQHAGAAAPSVQVAASPSEHTAGVRHVPDWQVYPEQQSLLAEHVAPEFAQQRPDWHSPVPQHPPLDEQLPPVPWQQRL